VDKRLKAILEGVFVSGQQSVPYSGERAAKAKREAVEWALMKIKELLCEK